MLRVRLSQPLTSDLGFDEFVPVSVGRIRGAHWGIPHSRGSAVQMATVKANGYVHIPAQVEGYDACQELEACMTTNPGSIERTLLIAGSLEPALEELADLARGKGIFLHASNVGNTGALLALKRGSCHAAPLSLPPLPLFPACSYLVAHLPPEGLTFVHIATVGQGIASREGLALGDLAGMRYVDTNRDSAPSLIVEMVLSSTGHRALQDRPWSRPADHAPGGRRSRSGAGLADATICTSRVAEAAGLRFVPVVWEDYELAVMRDMLGDPRVADLVALVNSPDFKQRLARSGGYDTSQTGRVRNLSLPGSGIDLHREPVP